MLIFVASRSVRMMNIEDDDEYDVVWDEIQTLFGLEGRQTSMKAEKLCPRSKDFLVKNQLQEGM